MSDDLRSRVIRLAHANPTLRPHLLPLLKTAAPSAPKGKGVLYVEREGARPSVWKEGVSADEAGKFVDEWEQLMMDAEDGDKAAKSKLRSIPMKEGMDAVFVDEEAEAWLHTGEWEYSSPAAQSAGAKLKPVADIIKRKAQG